MSAELELAALKLFNAELEEENERLRVELAAAKSKIEQLRAGKEEPKDEKIVRWDVDYVKEMMFTEAYGEKRGDVASAVKEALQQEYNMMMSQRSFDQSGQRQLKEYLKHDRTAWRSSKKTTRGTIPLEFTADRRMDTGDIVVRLSAAGNDANYVIRGDEWGGSSAVNKSRRIGEVVRQLFGYIYNVEPPDDVYYALTSQLSQLFHKEGLFHG